MACLAQPKVVAHRGYWMTEGSAQNSIASLQKAAEIGCWGSEFDVWMTADGIPVVFHDATIDGIRIEDTTYATLMNHRLQNGEFIPTLQQYLTEAKRLTNCRLIFEIKQHRNEKRDCRISELSVELVNMLGLADRTDYDLTQHINTSGKSLEYFDPETNEKYIPYVIEPSLGVERLFLSVVTEAYDEEELVSTDKNGNEKKDVRTVMHFHPALAPYKCAVLPLVKKLSPKAEEIYEMLSKKFMVDYDEAGTIGKRYRREDEIGTPFCITVDFDTIEKDNCVTVRDRDTMEQERIAIDDLVAFLESKIEL